MKARDIMTTHVAAVRETTPVEEIARLMLEWRVSGVPVTDAAGKVIGMVSEGDLIHRAAAEKKGGRSWWLALLTSEEERARDYVKTHGKHAKDVMTHPASTIGPDADLADIASILEQRRIKRVPVVEGGKLVGLVSRADVLRAMAAQRVEHPPVPASDRDLRDAVQKALRDEPWARSAVLNVIVVDGTVQLWGLVDSEDQRRALVVAAEGVPGVKAVEVHLGTEGVV
ncbi:MAG: CBS domain-containing protein [Ectothiorhodospiraceae bacterium]|nr:CBS domain-containing protein [Ectothiorhodospiraceae bacterium]